MYQLVAPLGRWGRRLERPEHRDGQDGRHDNGGGGGRDICAFPASTCAALRAQAYLLKLDIPAQLETIGRTGVWGFRYVDIIGRVRPKHFECGIPVTVDEKFRISCYFDANKR